MLSRALGTRVNPPQEPRLPVGHALRADELHGRVAGSARDARPT